MESMREFPDDETCLRHVWRERFSPDGEHAFCERCEAERVFKRYDTAQKRACWFCQTCGHRIHPLKGTIFERSSTSLQLWFYAMYLITSTRCGASAKQLERELGVTYKTAWRMFNKIRNHLMDETDAEPLSGDVEVDETFVGGKPRESYRREVARKGWNMQTAYWDRKAVVFGRSSTPPGRTRRSWREGSDRCDPTDRHSPRSRRRTSRYAPYTVPTRTNTTAATTSRINRVVPLAPNSAAITITASSNAHHQRYIFTGATVCLFPASLPQRG
jgi:transposase-like protein